VTQPTVIARRIEGLRRKLGLTQAEFAQAVGVGQTTVSGWEKGEKDYTPGEGALLSIGIVALKKGEYADAFFFWKEAGLPEEAVLAAEMYAWKKRAAPVAAGDFVHVPIEGGDPEDAPLALRAHLLPNPALARCLVVDEKKASLAFNVGDLIILDPSVNSDNTVNKQIFENQAVLVEFPPRGQRHSADRDKPSPGRPYRESAWWNWPVEGGLYAGRLRVSPSRRGYGPALSYYASLEAFSEFSGSDAGCLIGAYQYPAPAEEPIAGSERAKAKEEVAKANLLCRKLYDTLPGRVETREYKAAQQARSEAENRVRAELEKENRAAEEQAKLKAPVEWQLFDGVRILGLVIGWVAAPREQK
jgi:transcriptional regulator with XRE-family HTH domain